MATEEQLLVMKALGWADGTSWEAHLKDIVHGLMTCRAAQPLMDKSPCNYLVGEFLQKAFGVNDFVTPTGFLSADDMSKYVFDSKTSWRLIGPGHRQEALTEAQNKANTGKPVIAVYPSIAGKHGHVAIVLPGKLKPSSSWQLDVPNSASFFYKEPQLSFVGEGLSRAFSAPKRADVRLFYRLGT